MAIALVFPEIYSWACTQLSTLKRVLLNKFIYLLWSLGPYLAMSNQGLLLTVF